jgi:hypothetical protein
MTYGWPSPDTIPNEAPAPPALPTFADDHLAWRDMPVDPGVSDALEFIPEPIAVTREREAQARAARETILAREREARFVAEYCYDSDGPGAAARAGYSNVSSILVEALLLTPAVARAIRDHFDAMTPEDTRAYVERRLMVEARTYGKGKMPAAVIKALVEVARMKGFIAEPKETRQPYTVVYSQDDAKL